MSNSNGVAEDYVFDNARGVTMRHEDIQGHQGRPRMLSPKENTLDLFCGRLPCHTLRHSKVSYYSLRYSILTCRTSILWSDQTSKQGRRNTIFAVRGLFHNRWLSKSDLGHPNSECSCQTWARDDEPLRSSYDQIEAIHDAASNPRRPQDPFLPVDGWSY